MMIEYPDSLLIRKTFSFDLLTPPTRSLIVYSFGHLLSIGFSIVLKLGSRSHGRAQTYLANTYVNSLALNVRLFSPARYCYLHSLLYKKWLHH